VSATFVDGLAMTSPVDFMHGATAEYLYSKKRKQSQYERTVQYCLSLSDANLIEQRQLYASLKGYSGNIALCLLEMHGFDLSQPPAYWNPEKARSLARDVAMAINLKSAERSCAGIVYTAFLKLDIHVPMTVPAFMDELLIACQDLGPVATKNLLYSPWERYSDISPAMCLALKKSLYRQGEVVEVLISIIGEQNLAKAYARLEFNELLPFVNNSVKRKSIEKDLGM
jgi:hypothetical protein